MTLRKNACPRNVVSHIFLLIYITLKIWNTYKTCWRKIIFQKGDQIHTCIWDPPFLGDRFWADTWVYKCINKPIHPNDRNATNLIHSTIYMYKNDKLNFFYILIERFAIPLMHYSVQIYHLMHAYDMYSLFKTLVHYVFIL